MEIKDLSEKDLVEYLALEQLVKETMLHPEWLGDLKKMICNIY